MAGKLTSAARDAARRNTRMRLEQWAHNPTCEANTISAVRNVRMVDVARRFGLEATFGQSPFAIQRGKQFERTLFYNGAEELIEELVKQQVLPTGASGFRDLRIKLNGGTTVTSLDEAIEKTRELVCQVAVASRGKKGRVPAVVAGATIRIPKGILLPEAILIVDALAIRTDGAKPTLIVGEVKTYPDRGGFTDPHELSLARAQAGIYVHGLDLVVSELGWGERIEVSRRGFLVLTRPGSNRPAIRAGEDLHYQAERARRGFELLERAAAALDKELWAIGDGDPPSELIDAILAADTQYGEQCLSFCDLAPRCYAQARLAGDPAILGDDVQRFLGTITLSRAMELLNGSNPRNEAERDLCRRIAENDRILKS